MALTKVDLKGLEDGTDGQIITYDANGNPVAIGPGTDGQVLTSTGAGSPPAFENAASGGISDVVSDTSPQLGGDLDVQANSIISGTTNESIRIVPNGTGSAILNTHQVIVGDVGLGTAKEIISTGAGAFSIKSESGNSNISIIPHGTGYVTLDTDNVRVGDINADVTITTNGVGDLKLNTNAGTNSGTIEIEDGANNDIVITPNGTGDVIIDGLKYPQADGSADQVLKTNGSGQLGWAAAAAGVGGATGVDFDDTVKARFGTGNDLEMYHDGTDSHITNSTSHLWIETTTDDLILKSANDVYIQGQTGEHGVIVKGDAGVELYHNNSKKIETTSTGARLPDGQALECGTDNDLQLKHSGSHGHLDCGTGFMHISGSYVRINGSNGDHLIEGITDNTVNLFYDGSNKMNTTSSGITVTGSVNETSDAALKNNIQQLTNSLSNIKQLKGYSYEFKDTGVKSIGCTTQDVEKVYPDLVEGEEGNKTLQYSGLIGPLIEAVKELSAEVETLKTKVAALEAK